MKPFASSARWLVAVLIIIQVRNYTCLVIFRQVEIERKREQMIRKLQIPTIIERMFNSVKGFEGWDSATSPIVNRRSDGMECGGTQMAEFIDGQPVYWLPINE
jgi:hypothetical protein